MSRKTLVYAFHDNQMYEFERADRFTASVFGGPLASEIAGKQFGPKPLHRIACLSYFHIPVLSGHYLSPMPLVFGMHYSGCALTYHFDCDRRIEILSIDPATSSGDWPYENFPPLIPFIPLRLEDPPRVTSYDEFAGRFHTDMPSEPGDLIVCVPAPATIGLSFWGDWHDVTIVFQCDLKKRQVTACAMTD